MNPVHEPRIAWSIHEYETVSSTMDIAAELAANGAAEGAVVLARRQTAGRGRAGRAWANDGDVLQATLLLRPAIPAVQLTLAPLLFGIAAAEAITDLCPNLPIWLKWPNDLWVGDRQHGAKIGGILVEMKAGGAMLAGFGINIDIPEQSLPTGAICHRSAGCAVESPRLLNRLLAHIEDQYRALITANGRVPMDAWLSRAAMLGEQVSVVNHGTVQTGRFAGLREDGALLLEDAEGAKHAIVAGDLTRGPRLA
ncbi:MAG: biotin--[acetyl-CoA-carboxylase] ligase [Thermomicrobiales bacterium]